MTTRVPNIPVYVIYYILRSGGFATVCLQDIAKGVLDPQFPWSDKCVVRLRQPVDLVHTLKTVKGLFLLVLSRTPRSSGYDVYVHVVYVVVLYVYYMYIPVICCYMLYVCDMLCVCYMSSGRGGS
jgi:hypothetical protein